MKGCQDVLRRGSEEPGENELGSAAGTGQRVSCEARFEPVAPCAVDRVDGAVERIEKFIDDGEELAADALGQEAVVADVAEIAVWNVSNQPGEEVENGERKGLGGVGIVVEIFKDDGLAVVGLDA